MNCVILQELVPHLELKGMAVDLLKLMWDEMGTSHKKIYLVPWARGYYYCRVARPYYYGLATRHLNKVNGTVLFSTSRTEQRKKFFKWVCPIKTTRHSLIAEQLLLSKGFPKAKLQRLSKMKQNIFKLNMDRVHLVAFNEESIYQFIRELGFDTNDYKTVFVIQETLVCYAFNIQIPDSTISQFQKALDKIMETPIYSQLQNQYFGTK